MALRVNERKKMDDDERSRLDVVVVDTNFSSMTSVFDFFLHTSLFSFRQELAVISA